MKKETRQFIPEYREPDGEPAKGFGHFLVFNQETELWPGFREKIDPAALDDVMNDDVRVLVNHDSNLIVARTKAGTATISKDETGGVIEWLFPDTTAGRDLKENMRNGNIDGMSFGFQVKEDDIVRDKATGMISRTILKFEKLFDASPVVFPAYDQTDTQLRELRSTIESREDYPKDEPAGPDDPGTAHDDEATVLAQQKYLKLRLTISKNK